MKLRDLINTAFSWAGEAVQNRNINLIYWVTVVFGSIGYLLLSIIGQTLVFFTLYWLLVPSVVRFESELYFDFEATRPLAVFSFSSYDQQWLSANVAQLWQNPGKKKCPLLVGEEYDITLTLVLPETSANQNLGNFMVDAEILGEEHSGNKTHATTLVAAAAKSRKPVLLTYRTTSIFLLRELVFLPFRFFLNWFQPEEHVNIVLFEGWSFNKKLFPTGVRVLISDNKVQVKSARIVFELKLFGLRYLLRHWFYTTYLAFMALLLSLHFTMAFWLLFFLSSAPTTTSSQQHEAKEEDNHHDDDDQDIYVVETR